MLEELSFDSDRLQKYSVPAFEANIFSKNNFGRLKAVSLNNLNPQTKCHCLLVQKRTTVQIPLIEPNASTNMVLDLDA